MLIIWGKRVFTRELGLVADFCPICRDVRPMRLCSVRQYSHVYFIPVGRSEELEMETCCTGCKLYAPAAHFRGHTGARRRDLPLEDLIQQTFPNLREAYAERLDLERRLHTGALGRNERVMLLAEAIAALESRVARRMAAFHTDWLTALALLICIGGSIALLVVRHDEPAKFGQPKKTDLRALYFFAATLIPVIAIAATDVRRFVRRKCAPLIARSVAVMQPDADELTAAILLLEQQGFRIGRYLRARHVIGARSILKQPSASPDPGTAAQRTAPGASATTAAVQPTQSPRYREAPRSRLDA